MTELLWEATETPRSASESAIDTGCWQGAGVRVTHRVNSLYSNLLRGPECVGLGPSAERSEGVRVHHVTGIHHDACDVCGLAESSCTELIVRGS